MNLETLERRRLCSVSVVQGYPGYYEVSGDDADNVIAISASNTDSTFTLDGVTYGGVSFISVLAGDGDDAVSVDISGSGPIAASIDAGSGDDEVSLVGGGAVWGESGSDTIRVTDSYRGQAYGGPGDDRIVFAGASADTDIRGGPGNDFIDCSANAYPVFPHGDQGDDLILGSNDDDQLYGDGGSDLLAGNGGNDIFWEVDSERDRLVGGAGIDIAYVDQGDGVWGVEYVFYV